MKDSSKGNRSAKRWVLYQPRTQIEERLRSQIDKGREILYRSIRAQSGLERADSDFEKWIQFNNDLLINAFNDETLYDDFNHEAHSYILQNRPLVDRLGVFRGLIEDRIRRLVSIYERLEVIPEIDELGKSARKDAGNHTVTPIVNSQRVFIVHGHDEAAKESVARVIERLGFEPVILQEQPNQGRTIIEKFEDHADVAFAVVLLTPDDVGAPKTASDSSRPRARQNVILELGYFIGKLGRKHVCALHKGNVELPSDILGVVWTPIDENGAWRTELAREMRAAGLSVDLNKL